MNPYNIDKNQTPILRHGVTITKSDATVYDPPLQSIYVGGTGDVVVVMTTGEAAVTFKAVPVGTQLKLQAVKVMAATTATNLVGMH